MGRPKTIGSRAEVFHGNAKHTSGGLTEKDLIQNKHGRIVSRKKHFSASREKRLLKHGYGSCKGTFGYVKKVSSRRRRTHKGGMAAVDGTPVDEKSYASAGGNRTRRRH